MTERNYSIDVLKFFCAILVVIIHTEWDYQQAVLPIAKCSIPCFFIISGYLLFDKRGIKPERLNRNLIHISKITLWATFLFILLKEIKNIIWHSSLWMPSINDIIVWIVFNDNPFAYHLWYLYAYIYVLMIIMIVNKHDKWRALYWITPILLFIDLSFGKYSLLLWGWEPSYICLRNFLFVGIPYFAIGTIIKGNTDCIGAFNRRVLFGYAILFTLTLYLERYILFYLDKNALREHYISSTFLSIFVCLIALSIKTGNKSLLSKLGEKDSLYIYVFHPIFVTCCTILFRKMQLYDIYMCLSPIIVLFLTIIFIKCIRKANIIK